MSKANPEDKLAPSIYKLLKEMTQDRVIQLTMLDGKINMDSVISGIGSMADSLIGLQANRGNKNKQYHSWLLRSKGFQYIEDGDTSANAGHDEELSYKVEIHQCSKKVTNKGENYMQITVHGGEYSNLIINTVITHTPPDDRYSYVLAFTRNNLLAQLTRCRRFK